VSKAASLKTSHPAYAWEEVEFSYWALYESTLFIKLMPLQFTGKYAKSWKQELRLIYKLSFEYQHHHLDQTVLSSNHFYSKPHGQIPLSILVHGSWKGWVLKTIADGGGTTDLCKNT